MDKQTRDDLQTMQDFHDQMDALYRLEARRAARRDSLRFWFNIHQIANEPVVAEPTPGATAPSAHPGVGSGAVGSETPVTHTTAGFAGPAGPQPRRCPPCDGTGPATPHLPPPLCSRISAGITWT